MRICSRCSRCVYPKKAFNLLCNNCEFNMHYRPFGNCVFGFYIFEFNYLSWIFSFNTYAWYRVRNFWSSEFFFWTIVAYFTAVAIYWKHFIFMVFMALAIHCFLRDFVSKQCASYLDCNFNFSIPSDYLVQVF